MKRIFLLFSLFLSICDSSHSQMIIDVLPTPAVTVDEVVLAGDSIALQATTTGDVQNLSYVWRIVDSPQGSNPTLSSFTMVDHF